MTARKTQRGARKVSAVRDQHRHGAARLGKRAASKLAPMKGEQPRGPRASSRTTQVFVYGTLLAGEGNHRLLAAAGLIGPAATPAMFLLYNLGGYPGLVAGGHQVVAGEVYEVDAPTLADLDRLEGHPRFYQRTPITLADGATVQAYLLTPEKVEGRPVILSGDWRTRSKQSSLRTLRLSRSRVSLLRVSITPISTCKYLNANACVLSREGNRMSRMKKRKKAAVPWRGEMHMSLSTAF